MITNRIDFIGCSESTTVLPIASLEAKAATEPGILLTLSGPAIPVTKASANNKLYNPDSVRACIDRLMPKIRAKALHGELDHPPTDDIVRLATVKLSNASHRIDDIWFNEPDQTWYIKVSIWDNPEGLRLYNFYRGGSPLYVSLRSLLDPRLTKQRPNGIVDAYMMALITIDFVSDPGFSDAELTATGISNESYSFVLEHAGLHNILKENKLSSYNENISNMKKQMYRVVEDAETSTAAIEQYQIVDDNGKAIIPATEMYQIVDVQGRPMIAATEMYQIVSESGKAPIASTEENAPEWASELIDGLAISYDGKSYTVAEKLTATKSEIDAKYDGIAYAKTEAVAKAFDNAEPIELIVLKDNDNGILLITPTDLIGVEKDDCIKATSATEMYQIVEDSATASVEMYQIVDVQGRPMIAATEMYQIVEDANTATAATESKPSCEVAKKYCLESELVLDAAGTPLTLAPGTTVEIKEMKDGKVSVCCVDNPEQMGDIDQAAFESAVKMYEPAVENVDALLAQYVNIQAMGDSKYAGNFAIEHMPVAYKHIWAGLTDAAKEVLAKRGAEVATEQNALQFWANVDFIAVERAVLLADKQVIAAVEHKLPVTNKSAVTQGLTSFLRRRK